MTAGGVTDSNERLGRKAMALRDLRALLQMTPMPYWATPTLIGLGLAASLAETLGISFVVIFLYSAMGRADQARATGGVVGAFLDQIAARVGGGVALACLIFLRSSCAASLRSPTVSSAPRSAVESARRRAMPSMSSI